MNADWTVRPYREGDETALVALFARAFGKEMDVERWRWKLGPARRDGNVATVFVAEREGRLIFQYRGIPFRMRLAGVERPAMLAVEAMTDPEWRRRGLLTAVGRFAHAAWKEAGVALVTGLPNEQWGTRAAALGYEVLFPLEWRIRPLRPERTLARRLGVPALARLSAPGALLHALRTRDGCETLREVRGTSPEMEALEEIDARVGRAFAFAPLHDREHAAWRLLGARPAPYRVLLLAREGRGVAWAAVRAAETGVHLADLRAEPADLPSLLSAVEVLLFREGAEKIVTLAAPGTPAHAALRGAGYVRARHPFAFEVVRLDETLRLSELRDPARWLLAPCDFDVL